jgi:hypothetical protein
METILYRRNGRMRRASGTILATGPRGTVKVKPLRDSWGSIWVTQEEIKDGGTNAAPRSRAENIPPPHPIYDPDAEWNALMQTSEALRAAKRDIARYVAS